MQESKKLLAGIQKLLNESTNIWRKGKIFAGKQTSELKQKCLLESKFICRKAKTLKKSTNVLRKEKNICRKARIYEGKYKTYSQQNKDIWRKAKTFELKQKHRILKSI